MKTDNNVKKEKNVNNIYNKKSFKENWEKILQKAELEFSDKPDYLGKDFKKVMQEFLTGIEIKDYGYKNYYLAYLKWVRNSKWKIGTQTIGTGKMSIDIN